MSIYIFLIYIYIYMRMYICVYITHPVLAIHTATTRIRLTAAGRGGPGSQTSPGQQVPGRVGRRVATGRHDSNGKARLISALKKWDAMFCRLMMADVGFQWFSDSTFNDYQSVPCGLSIGPDGTITYNHPINSSF